jgi:hypothetical protein
MILNKSVISPVVEMTGTENVIANVMQWSEAISCMIC